MHWQGAFGEPEPPQGTQKEYQSQSQYSERVPVAPDPLPSRLYSRCVQCFAMEMSERGAEGKCIGIALISYYYGFPSFIVLAGQTHGNLPKVSTIIPMTQMIQGSVFLYVPDSFLTHPWISAVSSLASLPSSGCGEDGYHFTFMASRSLRERLLFTFRWYESSPFSLVSS